MRGLTETSKGPPQGGPFRFAMHLQRHDKSSAIQESGYDAATGAMRVRFTSGHLYHAEGIDARDYLEFTQAESLGKHWHAHLKGKDWKRVAE
jgi:KTSC domain